MIPFNSSFAAASASAASITAASAAAASRAAIVARAAIAARNEVVMRRTAFRLLMHSARRKIACRRNPPSASLREERTPRARCAQREESARSQCLRTAQAAAYCIRLSFKLRNWRWIAREATRRRNESQRSRWAWNGLGVRWRGRRALEMTSFGGGLLPP